MHRRPSQKQASSQIYRFLLGSQQGRLAQAFPKSGDCQACVHLIWLPSAVATSSSSSTATLSGSKHRKWRMASQTGMVWYIWMESPKFHWKKFSLSGTLWHGLSYLPSLYFYQINCTFSFDCLIKNKILSLACKIKDCKAAAYFERVVSGSQVPQPTQRSDIQVSRGTWLCFRCRWWADAVNDGIARVQFGARTTHKYYPVEFEASTYKNVAAITPVVLLGHSKVPGKDKLWQCNDAITNKTLVSSLDTQAWYVSLDIFATIFKNQYLYKDAMSQFQRICKQRLFIKVFFLPFQRFPDEISLRENLGRVNLNGKHHSVDSSEILTKNWELLKLYFFNNLIWETFELCKSCLPVIASEQK